jgi:predicted phosphohydrolase
VLKYLREVNDIHLDFDMHWKIDLWVPPTFDTDKEETAFIVAGDIASGPTFGRAYEWLKHRANQFLYVFIVLGNHDYWRNYLGFENRIREQLEMDGIKNVFVLQNSTMVVEGVKFVGGTLWTNFNNNDPLTRMNYRHVMVRDVESMNTLYADDGRTIVRAGPPITCDYIFDEFKKTRQYIFDNATREEGIRKVVVITHHCPSFLSIDQEFKDDFIGNGYYASELGDLIAYSEIDLWFHGHTHASKDYLIDKTRVINNARGYYPIHLNKNFNERMIIEL